MAGQGASILGKAGCGKEVLTPLRLAPKSRTTGTVAVGVGAQMCAPPTKRWSGSAGYSGSWPCSVAMPLGQSTARPQTSQIATSG